MYAIVERMVVKASIAVAKEYVKDATRTKSKVKEASGDGQSFWIFRLETARIKKMAKTIGRILAYSRVYCVRSARCQRIKRSTPFGCSAGFVGPKYKRPSGEVHQKGTPSYSMTIKSPLRGVHVLTRKFQEVYVINLTIVQLFNFQVPTGRALASLNAKSATIVDLDNHDRFHVGSPDQNRAGSRTVFTLPSLSDCRKLRLFSDVLTADATGGAPRLGRGRTSSDPKDGASMDSDLGDTGVGRLVQISGECSAADESLSLLDASGIEMRRGTDRRRRRFGRVDMVA
ncbi:hypothetical protein FB451DRAFT_1183168 [Mycena latifolia]|nr:hypothetical protein FB451DRAFT_1183168 [Mycena latifolia]